MEKSIAGYIFDHGNAELERARALKEKLLAALADIAAADSLDAAQEIACAAIAIAIADGARE